MRHHREESPLHLQRRLEVARALLHGALKLLALLAQHQLQLLLRRHILGDPPEPRAAERHVVHLPVHERRVRCSIFQIDWLSKITAICSQPKTCM